MICRYGIIIIELCTYTIMYRTRQEQIPNIAKRSCTGNNATELYWNVLETIMINMCDPQWVMWGYSVIKTCRGQLCSVYTTQLFTVSSEREQHLRSSNTNSAMAQPWPIIQVVGWKELQVQSKLGQPCNEECWEISQAARSDRFWGIMKTRLWWHVTRFNIRTWHQLRPINSVSLYWPIRRDKFKAVSVCG